jgi:hypothetical protein
MKIENRLDSNFLRRGVRILFAIAGFVGTFFVVEYVLLFFGVDHMSANGGALMLGLVVLGFVMYPKRN